VYGIPQADFILSDTITCANETIFSTYTGNNSSAATYNWDFSSAIATPGIGQGPHTIYWPSAGNHTMSLSVTENGCTSSVHQQSVTVNPVPTSDFNIGALLSCAGSEVPVTYTGNADTSATFNWNWDDATASTGIGMGPHTITSLTGGVVNLSLVVTQNGCSSDTSFGSMYFFDIPTAAFTISDTIGCTGPGYNYTVTYTGSASAAANFIWDFDGGVATPGTGIGPHSVTWANDGPKVITLYVEENGCYSPPVQEMILLQYTPTSFFTVTSQGGCAGNGFIIDYAGNGQANFNYAWNFNGGIANPGTGQGPHSLNYLAPGTYNVTLVVTNLIGCTSSFTATVTEPTALQLATSTTAVSCPSYSDGTATVMPQGGTPVYNIQWFNGTAGSTASNLSAGTYGVTVTDANGCLAFTTVTVSEPMVEQYSINTADVTCFGDGDGVVIVTPAANNAPYTYSLNGGTPQGSGVFNQLAAGTYTLVMTNNNGCLVTDTFSIAEPDALAVVLDPQHILALGESLLLQPAGSGGVQPYSYDWGPNTDINCTNCETPVVSPVFTTAYDLLLTDANGCQVYANTLIVLDKTLDLFVPNVFTPNNDNLNDLLMVYGQGIKDIELRIYDRWGEEIFFSNSISQGWDGTYKGKPLGTDVFVYRLSVTMLDNTQVQKEGSVTLMR
jgi:gliding motility-associated-like protein